MFFSTKNFIDFCTKINTHKVLPYQLLPGYENVLKCSDNVLLKITTVNYSFCVYTSVPWCSTSTGGHSQLYEHDIHAMLHDRVYPQVGRLRTWGK